LGAGVSGPSLDAVSVSATVLSLKVRSAAT